MPDGDAALEGLTSLLSRFGAVLNPVFDRAAGARDMAKCLYEGRTFLWTLIVGFITRHGSRNAMDANRNDPHYAGAVLRLAGQDDWPEGSEASAPCSQQCCNFLSRKCTEALEKALADLVLHMIRLKLLDNARFRGCFAIAVDGTKQERIRLCRWGGNRANRYVLEAKLVTPWGAAFSVASVPIKPWHEGNEAEKQDCEYRGFLRLVPILRKIFPRVPLCILGDSLYACAPLMEVCEENGWHYVFTFKEGRTPAAYADARKLMEADRANSAKLVRHGRNGKPVECGTLAWATGVEITQSAKGGHSFNVVKVHEDDGNGAPYDGQFATDLDVRDGKEADGVCKWGRRRWDIESSFNVEKHGGYGLEHNFCDKARVSRNIYLLMQIAHNLWQLFDLGVLRPLQKTRRNRNMTQRKWAQILLQKLIAVGIAATGDSIPMRYLSREFLA